MLVWLVSNIQVVNIPHPISWSFVAHLQDCQILGWFPPLPDCLLILKTRGHKGHAIGKLTTLEVRNPYANNISGTRGMPVAT